MKSDKYENMMKKDHDIEAGVEKPLSTVIQIPLL